MIPVVTEGVIIIELLYLGSRCNLPMRPRPQGIGWLDMADISAK
jgi:hypothetical protein